MRQIEMRLPNELGYERVAVDSAASTARMMGFSDDRIEDLKTALAEACINSIEHGGKKRATRKLLVRLTVREDRLQMDVYDNGEKFDIKMHRPRIEVRIDGTTPPRGWGIFLMRSLVDSVEVSSADGGNVTRLVMYLHRT